MDTLTSLKVFCQVVQNGSFTRAADALGISTAMASKHVSHLERSIQAKLLLRNSRNLHLTEAGENYYRECVHALETLATAAEKAALGADRPQGELRITAPVWFANPLFAQWMTEYVQQYPDVRPQISLDNRKSDLISEGFDLALRGTQDPNPSLIVKPLFDIHFHLCASADYIARHGQPQTPQDLYQHQVILQTYVDLSHITLTKDGQDYPVQLPSSFGSNNTLMMYHMVCAGAGIGYLPYWLSKQDFESGKLIKLLPEYTIAPTKLYAVYVDRAFLSAKVRTFIDFISHKVTQL